MDVSHNTGHGVQGGGPLEIEGSTVSDNDRSGVVPSNDLTLSDSTVAANNYGVFSVNNGAVTIQDSTISGNTHTGIGVNGSLHLEGSIVAGNNSGGSDVGLYNGTGTLTENFSLIGNPSNPPLESGSGDNLNGQDPQLGALADNGGPTKTMKPAGTSPVVDKGKDFTGTGQDQRGIATFDNAGIANAAGGDGRDIGAVELQAPTVSSLSADHGNAGDALTITGTKFTGATGVKFGSKDATDVVVVNDTTITAKAPAGNNGTVDVTVTTPDGTSPTSAADQFTYPTFQVDTTLDDGSRNGCTPAPNDCSLRGAINGANASAGSTITFASGVTGAITLGTNLPGCGRRDDGRPGADVLTIYATTRRAADSGRTPAVRRHLGADLDQRDTRGHPAEALDHPTLSDMAVSGNARGVFHPVLTIAESTVSGDSVRGVEAHRSGDAPLDGLRERGHGGSLRRRRDRRELHDQRQRPGRHLIRTRTRSRCTARSSRATRPPTCRRRTAARSPRTSA